MMRDAAKPAPNRRFQRPNSQEVRAEGAMRSTPSTQSSSKTNGIDRARANGHPTIAPVAKRRVDSRVRRALSVLGGESEKVNANVLAYIAKVEGRNADCVLELDFLPEDEDDIPVDAFHIPALAKSMKNKYRPTRSLILVTTARCKLASQNTEAAANVILTAKNAGLWWFLY